MHALERHPPRQPLSAQSLGRRLGSDLTLPTVIEIAYDHGLVESTCLSIDETWSGLRLTHPKPGKVYANSFGTLPSQR